MRKIAFSLVVLSFATAAFAEAPDLTGSMQFLCNPNMSRWPTKSSNDGRARSMTTIVPYKGKLYVSGGCWDPNMGYAPIFAVDPATGEFKKEYPAGAERIDFFREGSDGCLYAGGLDVHERSPADKQGAYFRKDLDGTWSGLAAKVGSLMHVWDICCWKGYVYSAGYHICRAPESSPDKTTDALPGDYKNTVKFSKLSGGTYGVDRRFYAFLPFKDDLFCIPYNYPYLDVREKNPFEEWRFSKSKGVFECTTRPWSEIAPNVDSTNPWCLYSARNVNHHVKATKVNLGEGVYPFCISTYTTKKGEKLLNVLAAQFDPTDRKVVNSVWESRDGVSFKELFTFKTDQQASAIARTDAGFFVGIGWRFTTLWKLACKDGASGTSGDDVSGAIYKIPWIR